MIATVSSVEIVTHGLTATSLRAAAAGAQAGRDRKRHPGGADHETAAADVGLAKSLLAKGLVAKDPGHGQASFAARSMARTMRG